MLIVFELYDLISFPINSINIRFRCFNNVLLLLIFVQLSRGIFLSLISHTQTHYWIFASKLFLMEKEQTEIIFLFDRVNKIKYFYSL